VLIAMLQKGWVKRRGHLVYGQSVRETVEIPEGDAERPLSGASLSRKFMNFAIPVVDPVTVRAFR